MNQKDFNTVAGAIFLAVAVMHALRLMKGWAFVVGSWSAPTWVSWAALVAGGVLAGVAFRLNKRRG